MGDEPIVHEPAKQPRWAWLASPRVPRMALALVLLIAAPSLGFGLRLDDRLLRILALGDARFPGMQRPPHRLFDFVTTPEQLEQLRRDGIGAWFGDNDSRLSFFRPLSSLLHWAEFRWLGGQVWLMHAVSIAAYAALVLAVLALYRRLRHEDDAPASGPTQAAVVGLAVWMFALDHMHGIAIGWIAQRNSVLAALFGTLAVVAHDRARRDGDRRAAAVAPALVLLSLLSAEAGAATVAVIVAHALTLEPRGSRLRAVAPYALAVVPWLIAYVSGGYGARRSGMYLDVVHAPGTALPTALAHFVTLLGSELGNPLTDVWPLAPLELRAVAVAVSAVLLVAFAAAAAPRLRRDPTARFLALATALSLLPPSVTTPQSRLLLFASVFQLALLARVAADWARPTPDRSRWQRRVAIGVTGYAVLAHSLLSPLLLTTTTSQMVAFERALGGMATGLPDDPAGRRRVVVVNAPDLTFIWYAPVIGVAMGRPTVSHTLALANGNRDVVLTGVDDHTIDVQNLGGFARSETDTLTRAPSAPLAVGQAFDVGDARFTVMHVDEQGHADQARVRFASPLGDPSLVFRKWEGTTLVAMTPPAPGQSVRLAGQPFLNVVVAASQGGSVDVPGR